MKVSINTPYTQVNRPAHDFRYFFISDKGYNIQTPQTCREFMCAATLSLKTNQKVPGSDVQYEHGMTNKVCAMQKGLHEHFDKIKQFIHAVEDHLNVPTHTRVTQSDNDKDIFIIEFDDYWVSKPPAFSFFLLLFRIGRFYDGEDVVSFMDKSRWIRGNHDKFNFRNAWPRIEWVMNKKNFDLFNQSEWTRIEPHYIARHGFYDAPVNTKE